MPTGVIAPPAPAVPRRRQPILLLFAALLAALLAVTSGCTHQQPASSAATTPTERRALLAAAETHLVRNCLTRQGLTLPEPGTRRPPDPADSRRLQAAVFGSGRTELAVELPTGYTVRGHSDGCLARARHLLYGDLQRWFDTSTLVANLRAEAARRLHRDPAFRAAEAEHRTPALPSQDVRTGALRARYLAAVRADRQPELTTYHHLRTRALHRAAKLLAGRTTETPRKS
jgi:hypothetical protein